MNVPSSSASSIASALTPRVASTSKDEIVGHRGSPEQGRGDEPADPQQEEEGAVRPAGGQATAGVSAGGGSLGGSGAGSGSTEPSAVPLYGYRSVTKSRYDSACAE